MKRVLFILVAICCICTLTHAQQSAICGDWTGIYESSVISDDVDDEGSKYFVTKDFKRTIRIKLIDGNYTVRMKIQRADGSGSVSYIPNAEIISADDHHISWKHDRGDDTDWDSSDRHNGRIIGRSSTFYYCSVTLTNGVLKFSDYWITTYYDRQGYKIDDSRWGESSNQTLYKDEDDW